MHNLCPLFEIAGKTLFHTISVTKGARSLVCYVQFCVSQEERPETSVWAAGPFPAAQSSQR